MRNGHAIIMQQGMLCRWGASIKDDGLPRSGFVVKQYLVKANSQGAVHDLYNATFLVWRVFRL